MKSIPIKTILGISVTIFYFYESLKIEKLEPFLSKLGFNFISLYFIIGSITLLTIIVEIGIFESLKEKGKPITEKKGFKNTRIMLVILIFLTLFGLSYRAVENIIELISGTSQFNIFTMLTNIIVISLFSILFIILVEQLMLKIKRRKKRLS